MTLSIPYGSSGWKYKVGAWDPAYADPGYDDSSWSDGTGMIATTGYPAGFATTPFTDGSSGVAGSEAGVNTNAGAGTALTIRRTLPQGTGISVIYDETNYFEGYIDGVNVSNRSTGSRACGGVFSGDKTAEWVLVGHAHAGNGLTWCALDFQITGTDTSPDDSGADVVTPAIGTPLAPGTAPIPLTTGLRKPPSQRDPEYVTLRHSRSLQSMSPGTATGRVANASPTEYLPSAVSAFATPDLSPGGTSDGGYIWSNFGALVARGGSHRLYAESTFSPTLIRVAVATAPVGQSVKIDVKKNLTTSILSGYIEIAVGAFTATGASTASLVAGDFLTVDVVQIGTTEPGRDMTVRVT